MKSNMQTLSGWVSGQAPATRYAVLAGTSDAAPLQHYYRLDGSRTPQGLYLGTPYAQWLAVMPYLVELDADSPFIAWADATNANEWGFVLTSTLPERTLYGHLQGLTQVWHQGESVFFRYWDGRYLLPVLTHLDDGFTTLLPGVSSLWVNGQAFYWALPERPLGAPRRFPWWELPATLGGTLATHDPTPLINNLMQQLAERNGHLYWSLPEVNLRLKVARFVARNRCLKGELYPALEAALYNEVQS